jgi:hypothetical protein
VSSGSETVPSRYLSHLSWGPRPLTVSKKRISNPEPPPALEPPQPQAPGVLSQLGVIGMGPIEPTGLGALIGGEPLLLTSVSDAALTHCIAEVRQAPGKCSRGAGAKVDSLLHALCYFAGPKTPPPDQA